jgi:hypothetical protein
MPLLRGILSLIRMLVGWSASSGSLYLFVNIIFCHLDYNYDTVLNYLKIYTVLTSIT